MPRSEKVRLLGTRVHVSHVQLDTRLPCFSACNIKKVGGAWGQGYISRSGDFFVWTTTTKQLITLPLAHACGLNLEEALFWGTRAVRNRCSINVYTIAGSSLIVCSSTVTISLTHSNEGLCRSRLVTLTCRAEGIESVTSLTWTASSYIHDQFTLSTGHDIGTTRPKNVQPRQTYANLTHNGMMLIESELHIFVENDPTITVNCFIDPPGDMRSVIWSEGTCMYMYMYSTAHMKDKHYTCVSRGGPVSYTCINSILHAARMLYRLHARAIVCRTERTRV